MSFMIEGRWRGYHSSQDRVVHRTYGHSKKFADRVSAAIGHGISFTDGTLLELTVVERRRPKKDNSIHGYDELISDCAYAGVDSVAALHRVRDAAQRATREKLYDISTNVAELHAMF